MTLLAERIVLTIIICVIVGGILYYTLNRVWTQEIDISALLKNSLDKILPLKKIESPETSGVILPGTKRLPERHAQIPKGAIALFLGNSLAYTSSFPHTVIKVGGEQALVIDKNKGGIAIYAKLFSEDGRIVAELKNNEFYVNPNNYFRIERPNQHALIVYDQSGQQALNVEFLNPSAIKLLGKFYFPSRPPIIIEEEWMSYGGVKMSNNTFGENKVDIGIQ